MDKFNADQANSIVQENLKRNRNRTIDETGVCFKPDIWAFPNNRKIFIGMYDYPMDKRTYLLVRRAMLRHNVAQKIKGNRVIIVCGLATLIGVLIAIHLFKSEKSPTVKNQDSYNSTVVRNLRDFTGQAHFYTR